MIYHYHIFVGKSIKSIVSASETGLVLLTRWESVKVPEYGSRLWLRSMAFVDTKLNNKPSKSRLEEERNRCEKQIRQWEKLISCARLAEHELWSCWRAAEEQTPLFWNHTNVAVTIDTLPLLILANRAEDVKFIDLKGASVSSDTIGFRYRMLEKMPPLLKYRAE